MTLPKNVQLQNFQKNLETLGVYKNNEFIGKIDGNTVDKNLAYITYQQLDYLCNNNNNCEWFKRYFSKNTEFRAFLKSKNPLAVWPIHQFFQEKINLRAYYETHFEPQEPMMDVNGYRRIYIKGIDAAESIDTTWYNYTIQLNEGNLQVSAIDTDFMWRPIIAGKNLGEFDMKPFFQNILQNFEKRKLSFNVFETIEKLPDFTAENDDFAIRLQLSTFPIDHKTNEDFYFGNSYISGILLIKDKNNILYTK